MCKPEDVPETLTVVGCILPGFTNCPGRLVATGHPADNVMRCRTMCLKWKFSPMVKDRILRHCDKEFHYKED